MSPRAALQPGVAVGLIRVSTAEQTRSGLGLGAQRQALQKAAERLGLQLVKVVEETGVSGGADIEKRTGLLEAIAAVPRGGVLLVAKLDRLSRHNYTSAAVERELGRKQARVVSAAGEGTDTGDDESALIQQRFSEAFAQAERLKIGRRTREALAEKRRNGEKLGGNVPIGFEVEQRTTIDSSGGQRQVKVLVPSKRDTQALRLMRDLHAKGYSLRAIGAELTKRGFRTKRGGKWQAKVIQSALQRDLIGTS